MYTLNGEKEMEVFLEKKASQRLKIYMNELFTWLILSNLFGFFSICFYFLLRKKLFAMKKQIVNEGPLNTKVSIK